MIRGERERSPPLPEILQSRFPHSPLAVEQTRTREKQKKTKRPVCVFVCMWKLKKWTAVVAALCCSLLAFQLVCPHVSQIEFGETLSVSVCCLNSPKQWALKAIAAKELE